MEKKKELSKNAFNKQAKTYDFDIKGSHARQLYPFILKKVFNTKGKCILDIGCGTGELMLQIFNEDSSYQLTGLDLSPEMLKVAKNKLGFNANFVLGDAENLPFDDNSFDSIICNDSFHHYPRPQIALIEMNRVLKKNGLLIIGDCYQKGITKMIMNGMMKFSHEGDVKIYSEKEMKDMMKPYFHHIIFEVVNHRSFVVTGEK